jgi:Flp pilus assembly protein TadD
MAAHRVVELLPLEAAAWNALGLVEEARGCSNGAAVALDTAQGLLTAAAEGPWRATEFSFGRMLAEESVSS